MMTAKVLQQREREQNNNNNVTLVSSFNFGLCVYAKERTVLWTREGSIILPLRDAHAFPCHYRIAIAALSSYIIKHVFDYAKKNPTMFPHPPLHDT